MLRRWLRDLDTIEVACIGFILALAVGLFIFFPTSDVYRDDLSLRVVSYPLAQYEHLCLPDDVFAVRPIYTAKKGTLPVVNW